MTKPPKKAILSVLSVLIIIVLSSCTQSIPLAIFPDGTEIKIELAISPEEKQKGLMFRKELAENSGMLFVQEKPANAGFWMKNTFIPLDIIFIDENKQVINIENAVPCKSDASCPIYKSNSEILYILEVNQGKAEEHHLKSGDKLKLFF